jgi:dTDP-4-amino-4,6-dideoxygalactose transaminase
METIQLFKVFMAETAATEVAKVLNSGYIGQGPKVEELEDKMKNVFSNDYLLSLNSGTSALHLAIHLLKKPDYKNDWSGLEPGDEVLTTSLTCTASNWPILANGLNIKEK